jgi:diguanylate cyclase (GGDEF)-like protein
VATWSTGPNRPALLALTAIGGATLGASAVAGSGTRLASSRLRGVGFAVWAVAGIGFILAATLLDHGLTSPLVWLFPLGTMFCALVHPPELVRVQAVGTFVAFSALAVADHGFTERPASVGLRLAYLVAVGFFCERGAAARWALHREQLELADRDPLTKLANHRVFHERLRAELSAAERGGEPVALLLVDLDRFKDVNDEHGHLVGDAALRAVADVLRAVARESDVAARVGGEEFGIVLRGTDERGAEVVAERVRAEVAAIVDPVPVTVSVGCAGTCGAATTAEALFDAADRAMYQAKADGRNLVRAA